jgi:phage terminase large subunit-like protein
MDAGADPNSYCRSTFVSRRKTAQELQESGGWIHLSKIEQARRLQLERRRPSVPVGLNQAEVEAFDKVCDKLEEQGCLSLPDGPAIVDLIRFVHAGDLERADTIFNSLLSRATPAVAGQEPTPPPKVIRPPDALTIARAYADDLVSGTIPAGKLARLAAKRFLDDLATGAERGLTFDSSAAQRCVNYITALGLELLPWQVFCLANIFGWKKANGLRRFREAFIEIAKKAGKTELSAAIALYSADTVCGDGEPRSNVFVGATSKYQSQSLCFKAAVRLRNNTPSLAARTQVWKSKSTIVFTDAEDSFLTPLAANSDKLNGQNMACAILDELGDHPTPALYNVFTSSSVGRKQPLTLSITTAGAVRESIAYEVRGRAAQALEGSSPTEAEAFFAFICELDDGDDPEDEANWIKANPSLDVLVPLDGMRSLLQSARALPSTKRAFLRFNLNIWAATTETGWVNFDDLTKQGNAYITEEDKTLSVDKRIAAALERRKPVAIPKDLSKLSDKELLELQKKERTARPFAALDAALVDDLSVLCWFWPPATAADPFEVFFRVWCPSENIERRSREQRVPYQTWADQRFIVPTSGSTTDFDYIERDILDLHKQFNFSEVGYDRALIPDLAQRLEKSGLKLLDIKQGYALSAAIQHIEKLVIERRFCCFGNPIWAWCASNVQLRTGFKEDVQLYKERSREKIDAAAAAVMAMDVWLKQPQQATKPPTDGYAVRMI